MSRCFFFWHAWTKWTVIKRGRVLSTDGRNDHIGEAVLQERTCAKCGFTDIKTTVTTL